MDQETRAIIAEVASEASQKAVSELLIRLGIDHTRPLEVQRDMIALRELRVIVADPKFQADMAHLRRWRITMERMTSKGMLTGLTAFVMFVLSMIVLGLKDYFMTRG